MIDEQTTMKIKARYEDGEKLKEIGIELGYTQHQIQTAIKFYTRLNFDLKPIKKDYTENIQLIRRAESKLIEYAHELRNAPTDNTLVKYNVLLSIVSKAEANGPQIQINQSLLI